MPQLRYTWLAPLLALAAPATAPADDWMFRRSYYSHAALPGAPVAPPPPSRSAYRPAISGYHPRFAIRGGYRWNSIILQNGNSTDRLMLRENWADAGY